LTTAKEYSRQKNIKGKFLVRIKYNGLNYASKA